MSILLLGGGKGVDYVASSGGGGTPILASSGLVLQLEADDITTLFQDVAGSTAVSANGQTVGMWKNKQADGFNPAAASDGITRPTYGTGSGLSWIQFDGTDDILFTLTARGLYAAGACTIIAAMRPVSSVSSTPIAEGESSSAFAGAYGIFQSAAATPVNSQFTQKNTDGSFPITSSLAYANAFPANTDVVYTVTDTGTALQAYKDGTTDRTASSYARGTGMTPNRFSVGGNQRGTASGFYNGRIYGAWAWNRVLNTTELANAVAYAGLKQGRVI